jgi:hypothetical protein
VTRFQPQVAVQANGTVYVFYLTLTVTGLGSFLAHSTTSGISFEQNQSITNGTQSLSNGEVDLIGERQGLALGAQAVYPFWSDLHNGIPEVFTTSIPAA